MAKVVDGKKQKQTKLLTLSPTTAFEDTYYWRGFTHVDQNPRKKQTVFFSIMVHCSQSVKMICFRQKGIL